ncbi:hypothetical protein M378DRAFT_160974 [Amanita muscaria Koide BX008]|uniref:Uncharacterized protein n=1 Tax=Amanita muscaria (strain Koide BX008) TaxID=946122 RepID=A0A0C2WXJ8_AMAMK|nr:hypothetical protein M378DRAFT_160974 [Amanita muscaria Koide BX008]
MQFLSEKSPSDILNNRQPVIVYAPPPSDSPHERSKRIFLSRSYDYQGHPRIGSKTAKKRCLVNPLADKPEKRRQLFQGEASMKFMDRYDHLQSRSTR